MKIDTTRPLLRRQKIHIATLVPQSHARSVSPMRDYHTSIIAIVGWGMSIRILNSSQSEKKAMKHRASLTANGYLQRVMVLVMMLMEESEFSQQIVVFIHSQVVSCTSFGKSIPNIPPHLSHNMLMNGIEKRKVMDMGQFVNGLVVQKGVMMTQQQT